MQIYHRSDWHARRAGAWPGSRPATDWATIHWSGSKITSSGVKAGHTEPTQPKPKKPGPKWYRLWRDSLTPRVQRIKLSRAIRKYNKALRAWNEETAGVNTPLDPKILEMERQTMRVFQNYHMDGHGWSDIGYHYAIFASGNVYEGRLFSARGAHAYGANHTTGVCFVMGPGDEPTSQMLAAFDRLKRDVGIKRYRGHNQWPENATACPGPALKQVLRLPVE